MSEIVTTWEYEVLGHDVMPHGPRRASAEVRKYLSVVAKDDAIALKASHHVGLFPIPAGEGQPAQLITVLPKVVPFATPGSQESAPTDTLKALALFFDWVEASQGTSRDVADAKPEGGDLTAQVHDPAALFMLMLASRYADTLRTLARRGLRRHYRREEETLHGRVRGRVRVVPYGRNLALGRPDLVPVAWDEFTLDHEANRLLRAAAEVLVARGVGLDAVCGQRMRGYFRVPLALLGEVESGTFARHPPISRAERDLRRLSPEYDRALGWARLILAGNGTTRVDGRLGVLAINTNKVFEDFALRIAERAMGSSDAVVKKTALEMDVLEKSKGAATPDIVISRVNHCLAIGDAKYKRVLSEPPPPEESEDVGNGVWKVRLARADLYQLYTYMRLASALRGFFIVPRWNMNHDAAHWWPLQFGKAPPVDDARLGVLFLNLAKPVADVMREGAEKLKKFLHEG
jgi:hypothetical protein